MFEDLTFEDLMERMLERIDDSYDKRESSPIYAALAPAALELMNIYNALDDMFDECFADTASREYLIRLAASRGIVPYAATEAVVKAEFTPDTIELNAGDEFTSPDEDYVILDKISPGIYRMKCKEAGEGGNLYTGEIVPVEYVEGLESATITEILIYGEDDEDTDHLRERYMDTFQANKFGGNRLEYKENALAISGVGAVKVVPAWNGAGTVKLVILSTSFDKASEELIGSVQTKFDPDKNGMGNGLAPIGHIVTVESVEEVRITVRTKLTFDNGYDWDTCGAQIKTAVSNQLLTLRQGWSEADQIIVRVAAINSAILSVKGVLDAEGTTLNDTAGNLNLSEYQIPVMGGITVE